MNLSWEGLAWKKVLKEKGTLCANGEEEGRPGRVKVMATLYTGLPQQRDICLDGRKHAF